MSQNDMVTKKYCPLFLIFAFLLICPQIGDARHIIGGDITYECLGDGSIPNTRNYRITMKVYRDCLGQGAEFDNPASIGVFSQVGSNFTFIRDIRPNLGSSTFVNPDDNPCFILPPNVCVEEGIYIFDVANLPILSNGSYHISWQRCCRNNTINNIVNPESTGATYTVEITAEAQQACNISPTFNQFPPIVICANENLVFDHSATDSEGDLLVYEFCAPLIGGGTVGTNTNPGDAEGCEGVRPAPENCPPPYSPVTFQAPNYTLSTPLAGSPLVTINGGTGLITGRPTVIGQFVVGVCVKEYRGGVLLSVLRRDFQFNVTNCEPTVRANIMSDRVVNGENYIINSCGENTVQFQNLSQLESNISSYKWEFDLGGGAVATSTIRNPSITFPDLGTYEGSMIVNEGTECADTAFVTLNVYPFIKADFEFDYDTCIGGPVTFTDLSQTGSGLMTDWNWDFGDLSESTIQNPTHLYMSPGNIDVTLVVQDINECRDSINQTISYFPVPPVLVIKPSTFSGCNPSTIFFDNLSFPIDSTYDIVWDFGDGQFGTDISPTHVYDQVGVYSVGVEITSPIGCFISDFFQDWITIKPSPQAGFSYSPDKVNNFQPEVDFLDESIDGTAWQWNFESSAISFLQNPTYAFQDTGVKNIQQIVFHPNGCTDTAYARIDVEPQYRYFLPNAFSPNQDGKNEVYKAKGFYEGIYDFQLSIWSRWGEMLFETNDPNEGWNGRKDNIGDELPVGVYIAKVRFRGPRNQNVELQEFATLVR